MNSDDSANNKSIELCEESDNDLEFIVAITQTFPSGVTFEIDFPISWRVFSIALALSCSEKPCKPNTKIAVAKYMCRMNPTEIKVLVQDDKYIFALEKKAQPLADELSVGGIIKIEYEEKLGQRFASDITKLF